ncbi:MAG: ribose 5-phosphate isomerase B [Aaplasma endosymbiont of Hyalomma asiaticum]
MLVVKRVFISSDHAGVELRLSLKEYLEGIGCAVVDCGCDDGVVVDYPDYVAMVAQGVSETSFGVLVCGTGIGMSIAANRYRHVRAALCHDKTYAQLAREHNNANVLCFGSRYIANDAAKSILHTFLTTKFSGGRHLERVKKLSFAPSFS